MMHGGNLKLFEFDEWLILNCVQVHFKIMKIHRVHFIVSLSTAALSNIKPASAGTPRDCYCDKRHVGRGIYNSAEFRIKFTVRGGYCEARCNCYQV
jgi:hypothetical protein